VHRCAVLVHESRKTEAIRRNVLKVEISKVSELIRNLPKCLDRAKQAIIVLLMVERTLIAAKEIILGFYLT